jgi:hypothetical protein
VHKTGLRVTHADFYYIGFTAPVQGRRFGALQWRGV